MTLNRRAFLTAACSATGVSLLLTSRWANTPMAHKVVGRHAFDNPHPPVFDPRNTPDSVRNQTADAPPTASTDEEILDNIDAPPPTELTQSKPLPASDIILDAQQHQILTSTLARLNRLQKLVGYGNFNIIGWDDALKHARNHSPVGNFENEELNFIEDVFSTSAPTIGFYGDKVVTQLTSTIPTTDVQKVPHTGHYLYKGQALATYKKIRQDIGDTVILTSGIRSVVKQIYLFLNKVSEVDGNLSLASYSLAPPGHSYHAIGDFDVGKVGFGKRNFSDDFSQTDEFKRLSDFGYFDIRYPQNNPYGVRYEPWHIKVV